MFKKLFGRSAEPMKETSAPKSCTYCANLLSENELLRKDNSVLMGRFATAGVALQQVVDDKNDLAALVKKLETTIKEKNTEIAKLQARAEGTPVKYVSARKTLTKTRLKDLRARLEAVPANVAGFGGSVSLYDKKTKRVSVVQFSSKADAMAILERAEKGNVEIIM